MNNNLFRYATSELSQDAFICWLLSYAIKDCDKDEALTNCAKEFIRFFIPELKNESIYLSEPPCRQYKSIDVLITVNDKYKVIIEDKTFTSDHDNQLLRYIETVTKDFPNHKVIGIYYKTGFQSDLSNVRNANYSICDREKILAVLSKYIRETSNDIFKDYYDYINDFEQKVQKFKTLPIKEWSWEQINGFYDYCQRNSLDSSLNFNYGYVPNQTGGFDGMWIWKPIYIDIDGFICEVYLQCEFENGTFRICYRASAKEGKVQSKQREALIWKKYNNQWVNVAEKHNFKKPQRYGVGSSVALGVYNTDVATYQEAVSAIKNAISDFYAIVKEIE